MVRGDSHFATPEVMDLLEQKRCGYIFGLSTNMRLTEIGRPWSEDVATRRALSKSEKMRRFFQTSYAAASWSKPRKIVARVEASEQGSDIRFIVTNLPGRAKVLYEKVYCARGRMENLIKDMKLYTRSDRTSCHRWEANQFRLFLHMGAYWLLLATSIAPREADAASAARALSFNHQRVANVPQHPPPSTRLMRRACTAKRLLPRIIGARLLRKGRQVGWA